MKIFLFCLSLFALHIAADNFVVAEKAQNLNFLGTWKLENSEQQHSLQQDDLLLEYNGFVDYPVGSGYVVSDSKTFARIIVSSECGYTLPAGSEYATGLATDVEPGDVLQRAYPEHTMVVAKVQGDEVTVVHTNWSAQQRVSINIFSKNWLQENNFLVFRPGIDAVDNEIETAKEQIDTQVFGTYRVVVTGSQDYFPISQGTIVSHSGPGGKIIVDETRAVSNTFSCNVGVKVEIISASVGFSVTSSFSRTLAYVRDVTPGKYGYVDLIYKYMVKNFDVYYKPFIGSEEKVGSGKAYQFQAVQFNYRESNN